MPIYDTEPGARSHRSSTDWARPPLRASLYIRYHRGTVKTFGRMRRGSWLAVLLLAALVIAPAADCLLFQGHTGPQGHHSITAAAPEADHDHDHAINDAPQQCVAHAVHCPDKALPAGIVSLTSAALVLAALTAAVWAPASTPGSLAGGIRGPPAAPRSPGGRTVLTLYCISRR
ncbi:MULTISPECIES: hypothetical protein [Nocardia]|uniref:hypothetical protein n=1 Tax=Nocardia TaxID=1817 RepID=UPI0010602663|nr:MULTISPECIES: hypothetical protein [Nocardia]